MFGRFGAWQTLEETENHDAIAIAESQLYGMDWGIYEVQRVYKTRPGSSGFRTDRRLTTLVDPCDRDVAIDVLCDMAGESGLDMEADGMFARVQVMEKGDRKAYDQKRNWLLTGESLWAIAPAYPQDKVRHAKTFAHYWDLLLSESGQYYLPPIV